MPEGRRAPWKYLPRPGARLSVTFGAPLSPAVVRAAVSEESASASGMALWRDDDRDGRAQWSGHVKVDAEAEVKVRIALTELMQRAVEVLGRQVSGDLLTGSPDHHHNDNRHRT